jgi:hypothetical protein
MWMAAEKFLILLDELLFDQKRLALFHKAFIAKLRESLK